MYTACRRINNDEVQTIRKEISMTTNCSGFDCDATTDADNPTDEGWIVMPDGKMLCVDCRADVEMEKYMRWL
jgi:hypothetical protein